MELEQSQITLMSNLGCLGHRQYVYSGSQGSPGLKILGLTQWNMADFTEHKQETGHNWGTRKERTR